MDSSFSSYNNNQKSINFKKETTPNTNKQGALKPRKKYSLLDEVKRNVSQMKKHGEWVFIPRKDVLKRIQQDYNNQVLYARGVPIPPIDLTLHDVLRYITILPPPEPRENPRGKRMRLIPLFYEGPAPDIIFHISQQRRIDMWRPVNITNTRELMDLYQLCEDQHKNFESHHPDGRNFKSEIAPSFEAVIDVYSSLLRSYDVEAAYWKLLELLKLPKFEKLEPSGTYYALMHILVRGVAQSARLLESSAWRKSRTQAQLWALNKQYSSGGLFTGDETLKQEYLHETTLHANVVRREMIRVRQRADHDHTKFHKKMIYAYTWYWGVFQQLSKVNQHRALSGCDDEAPNVFDGVETMYSMGKSFGDGLASSSVVDETISKVSGTIKETVKEVLTEEREAFASQAQEIVSEISRNAENISDQSMTRMERLIGKLNNSLDSALDAFESLKTVVGGFFEQVVEKVKTIAGFASFDITVDSVFTALRDYILYINVTSRPLKIIYQISY